MDEFTARPLRYEAVGAVYHVMARGDGGKTVFEEDKDRYGWVDLMERACESYGWRVHEWVLMGNHFHLLVETPEPNLVAGMKWLLGVFSQGWNRRRQRKGHVFQGRYKAVVVNGEEREVPLTELIKGYSLESDYRIKTSQTAEQARAAQEQFSRAQAMQQHYGQQLQQYQSRLAQMQPAQPDPGLIESDPVNYLRQQQAWQSWQGQMVQAQNEAQALQYEQQAQAQQYSTQRLTAEAEALVKVFPEFADATKAQATKAEIAGYLKKAGFSDSEVGNVADHRAVVLARKAMLYDQMMGKQAATAQKLVNVPPKAPQRPGVSNISSTDGRTRAMQSLKRSGSMDDAANAFAAMLSKR